MKKIMHPGNLILVGFGGMVLFMCYLVYQCTQNPSVMVSQHYYEQELVYQDLINAKTNTLPYSDSLLMNRQQNTITFQIPLSINKEITKATVLLYNRADDKKDITILLEKNNDGLYAINTSDWGQGNYELKLSIQTEGKQYYKEFNY